MVWRLRQWPGDTADRRGDDAEAGARMDCDDVGGEGGVQWVTVRCEPMQRLPVLASPPVKTKKPRKRSPGDRANNNKHDSPHRKDRRRDIKLIVTGHVPQAPQDEDT